MGDIALSSGPIIGQSNKARKNGRDFEPGKFDGVGLGVSNPNREVQRETRDVGEKGGRDLRQGASARDRFAR